MVQWGGSPERRMDARWNFRWTYIYARWNFRWNFRCTKQEAIYIASDATRFFGVYTGLESRNEIISDVSLAMFLAVFIGFCIYRFLHFFFSVFRSFCISIYVYIYHLIHCICYAFLHFCISALRHFCISALRHF